jgi:Spy/CpxP family protein refolding chaperone
MKKFLFVALLVFSVSAARAFAEDEKDPPMGGEGMGHEMMEHGGMMHALNPLNPELMNVDMYLKFSDKLGLSKEQVSKLRTIKTDFEKLVITKEADVKIAFVDIRIAHMQDKPDFTMIRQKAQEINKIMLDVSMARIDAMEKAYNVLTDQQRAKLPEIRKSMREGMMEMHEKHVGREK